MARKNAKNMKKLGLYLHIPFCASRCQYCDFCTVAGQDGLMGDYQKALMTHLTESAVLAESYLVDTVYFGGGTPSYYGADRLAELMELIKKQYALLVDSEVTLEANPDSVDPKMLKKLLRAGFNRISIGVQSANDSELKDLGRRHNFARAEYAVKAAQDAGFKNVSIDLMYGLPYQTRDGWAENLGRAATLKPNHISAYALKLEEGTPLYERRELSVIPDDDEQAAMYLYAVSALERLGYRQYEISNFAMPGFESKHNLKYWQLEEYMGLGASAYSDVGTRRYGCIADVKGYIDGIKSGGSILVDNEQLSPYDRAAEYIMLALRTTRGISEDEYRAIYQTSFEGIDKLMASYQARGLARRVGDRWSFTPQGFLISNLLIGEVIDLIAEQKSSFSSAWREEYR